MSLPRIADRDLDHVRSGADSAPEHLIVAAHVRGYGGVEGASLLLEAIAIDGASLTQRQIDVAAEGLARASRHDCGRDPDALSFAKVSPAALTETFRASNQGLLLDAMCFGGLHAEANASGTAWHLQDPSFDLHRALVVIRGERREPTSNAYAVLSEEEALKVTCGNIMRRLARLDDGRLLVRREGASDWSVAEGGDMAIGRADLASALAGDDAIAAAASSARRVGGVAIAEAARRAQGRSFSVTMPATGREE